MMDADTGAVLSEYKSGPEQIDAVAFSPGTQIFPLLVMSFPTNDYSQATP